MKPPSQVRSDSALDPCSESNTLSLLVLFQVLTACCIFLSILRWSPAVALLVTGIAGPAVIRTAWISELQRRRRREVTRRDRLLIFARSIVVVLVAAFFGLVTFVAVSLGFGLLGLLFGCAVSGMEFGFEAQVIGTIGGMVWGMAAGFLAICFAICKLWKSDPSQHCLNPE